MPSKEDIDRIVSEVMRRLAGRSDTSVEARTPEADASLRISAGVVSLSAVEGRLDQVRQLVVSRRSVITPAVRDVLKNRDIELVREHSSVSFPSDLTPRVIVANTCSVGIELLRTELPSDVRLLHGNSLSKAVSAVTTELNNDNTLGLIITDAPEAAVCLANRNAHVRAIFGLHEESVKRAVSTIAANMLIITPLEKSVFEIRRLLRVFLNTPRQTDSGFQVTCPNP